jgi:predicted deacylase
MRIHRQFFAETHEEIAAPIRGVVIGISRNPLTNVGDALVHVASIKS